MRNCRTASLAGIAALAACRGNRPRRRVRFAVRQSVCLFEVASARQSTLLGELNKVWTGKPATTARKAGEGYCNRAGRSLNSLVYIINQ
jgi:uncharacterized low-complexity protein